MSRNIAMILAGGAGTRLFPLTQTRTKPAVPFAGGLRLIDFVLNNFVNSDILKLYVLTQFKSQSLNIHLRQAWHITGLTGNFIDAIPAQMRMGKRWYEGTADAIYQNLRLIEIHEPDNVYIFGSDHIYKIDIRQVQHYHEKNDASLTVCAIPVLASEAAGRFGVIEVDEDFRMIGFEEKPEKPKTMPGRPDLALVSMGNYVFKKDKLFEYLTADAEDKMSSHDFGHDILPKMVADGEPVYVYDFNRNEIPGEAPTANHSYWRDVGTVYSFWEAHMDLLVAEPEFDLYNSRWPLRSYHPPVPPANIMADENGNHCTVLNSMISSGSEVTGAHIERSVLGFNAKIEKGTKLVESIMLGKCQVGENCVLNKVIADKSVKIAPNTQIGVDLDLDRSRGLTVSEEGIVVIPKNMEIGF